MPRKSNSIDSTPMIILLGVSLLVIISIILIVMTKKKDNFKLPNPKLAVLTKPKKPTIKKPFFLDISKLSNISLNMSEDEYRAYMINIAKRRLDRERPSWVDAEPIIQHKDEASLLEFEAPWTEAAGWMSMIRNRNRVVICGDGRTTMKILTLGPDFTETFGPVQHTISLPSGHTRFGQGSEFRWISANGEEKMIYMVPMTRSSGGVSLGLYSIQSTLVPLTAPLLVTDIHIFHAGWVTQDPISKNVFIQLNSGDIVSSRAEHIGVYDLRNRGGNSLEFTLEYLLTTRVRDPIEKCTGGFFSRNGIMYMANNDDDTSGFNAYKFGYDALLESYTFTRLKTYRVRKPDESIWSSDSQDIVGFTSLYGYFNLQPNLFGILHKNEDIGDDNISWTSVEGLM